MSDEKVSNLIKKEHQFKTFINELENLIAAHFQEYSILNAARVELYELQSYSDTNEVEFLISLPNFTVKQKIE